MIEGFEGESGSERGKGEWRERELRGGEWL